jgi:hypothetical protein
MLSAQTTDGTFYLVVPLKSSLSAAEASGDHFCGMNTAPGSRINPQRGHQA